MIFCVSKRNTIEHMKTYCKIYLICYCNGRPIDFLLPVYSETQFADITEVAGTCFKIEDTHNAEILLACHEKNELNTLRINIESACKINSNISFSIVINEDKKTAFLRAFTDKQHNGFYPIPFNFLERAGSF